MAEKVTGRCLCGSVRYEVDLPSKWCAHCHCSMCRRAHGAGYVTWVGVAEGQFRLLCTEAALGRYSSSPGVRRSFCRTCGATFLFESERWPGEVHVTLASFDGDIDKSPQAHAFYDSRAPWVCLGDSLPRLGGDSGTEPLAE